MRRLRKSVVDRLTGRRDRALVEAGRSYVDPLFGTYRRVRPDPRGEWPEHGVRRREDGDGLGTRIERTEAVTLTDDEVGYYAEILADVLLEGRADTVAEMVRATGFSEPTVVQVLARVEQLLAGKDGHRGWTCVRCGTHSRTRFGRWLHTYFAWNWRKGHGGRCTRFLWWGER